MGCSKSMFIYLMEKIPLDPALISWRILKFFPRLVWEPFGLLAQNHLVSILNPFLKSSLTCHMTDQLTHFKGCSLTPVRHIYG